MTTRTLSIFAHSRDCNSISFPGGHEHDGYVPDGIGIGGGDDVQLTIDIDTGIVVGWSDALRDAVLAFEADQAEGDE